MVCGLGCPSSQPFVRRPTVAGAVSCQCQDCCAQTRKKRMPRDCMDVCGVAQTLTLYMRHASVTIRQLILSSVRRGRNSSFSHNNPLPRLVGAQCYREGSVPFRFLRHAHGRERPQTSPPLSGRTSKERIRVDCITNLPAFAYYLRCRRIKFLYRGFLHLKTRTSRTKMKERSIARKN